MSSATIEAYSAELAAGVDVIAIDRLVQIAWHLRQRDTKTALDLAIRAERSANNLEPPILTPSLRGRLCLVRAEAAWLSAHFARAHWELNAARENFEADEDWAGCGDAFLLEHQIASDQGDSDRRCAALNECAIRYARAGDDERTLNLLAWEAVKDSFNDVCATLERAAEAATTNRYGGEPGIVGLINFARALLAFSNGDYGRARRQFEQAAAELRESGLVRQAIASIINAGAAAGNLSDFESHAEIVTKALALARATNWPQSLAACLYSLADAHHSLGRFADARSAFSEARALLQPVSRSRSYVVVTTFLAETDLRLGRDDEAYDAFRDARAAAERGSHQTLLPRILVGLSACLSRRSFGAEALATASEALTASEGRDLVSERLALLQLARIHGTHELPLPPTMEAASASLHFLERLWSTQAKNAQWTPDDELLSEFAFAWERLGEFDKALRYERLRIEALTLASTSRAERQVVATQARQEALTARLESDHQRSLLESERRRQMVLEQLSGIGRDITGSLSAVEILYAVDRHVHAMLDTALLSLWLLKENVLEPIYSREDGQAISLPRIRLDDLHSTAAQAAREQQELLIEQQPGEVRVNQIPGTKKLATALFAPLSVGARMLGVISIQSAMPHAYGEQERLIFQNICAFTAIALANASNYEMVHSAHAKLIAAQEELERLANIDGLTDFAIAAT